MRNTRRLLFVIVVAMFWLDGCGFGIGIGLAIASNIEGRGFWQYLPDLVIMCLILVPFVLLLRKVVRDLIATSSVSSPIPVSERLPDAAALVLAWKPLINGWDIVLGRQVAETPEQFTHWRPMLPSPV